MTRTTVSAEIDLSDIDTGDLVDELIRRAATIPDRLLTPLLKAAGCSSLIKDDCYHEPVPSALMLRDWCLACGEDPAKWVKHA